MEILVINESVGKSLVKTRRILSEVLPQLGSNTFCGRVDAVGLKNLFERLKKNASKATSVTCHKVSSNSTEFLWCVGNTRAFDEQGRYSFRQLRAPISANSADSPGNFFLVLRRATRLAALFHDLGKASALFQNKLRDASSPQSEPLRHEVLSYLMLLDALDPGADEEATDTAWLERLISRPERIGQHVTETSLLSPAGTKLAQTLITSKDQGKQFLSKLAKMRAIRPIASGVLWLVLTHHGLPGTRKSDNLERHLHPNRYQDPNAWTENLKPAAGEMPWQNSQWRESVRAEAALLLREMQALDVSDKGALATPHWALALAQLARPALILGDYKASILKSEAYPLTQTDVVLANTRDKTLGGDSLTTHLLAVKSAVDLLFRYQRTVETNFLTTRIPEAGDHGIRQNNLPARFQWQKRAADKVREVCQEHHGAGFFGVVVSGTGAGKTIGGVRLMDAACGGVLRYSLPLSRKSLTLQAGADYRQDTGLSESAVAVVIGSHITKVLGELTARGSDSLINDPLSTAVQDLTLSKDEELLVDYSGAGSQDEQWRTDFEGADEALFRTTQALDVISAPILVSTADYLTGGVELLRGKHSLLSLRLMSSDLLLDEIDNYSARDLVSLGKLVFAAGMYGRKVVLMSATMARPIVDAYYSAYCKGLELAALLRGTPVGHVCAVISNESAPYVVLGTTPAKFLEAYKTQIRSFLGCVEAQLVKRTVSRVSLTGAKTANDCFDIISAETNRRHGINKLQDPTTGVSYSVGFVRFNTAKTCFQASKYLAGRAKAYAAEHGVVVKYVTYHAKQTVLAVSAIDRVLGRVLKRSETGELTGHVEVSALLQQVARDGFKDVVIVVLTTSLLETGRDQDYDWATMEPRSNRGEHQAKGRVRRHRHEQWLACNVSVLSHPIRNIVKGSGGWGRPGVERKNSCYQVKSVLHKQLQPLAAALGVAFSANGASRPLMTASEALPLKQWEERVSARQCLEVPSTYEENPIGALEQLEMYAHLVDSGTLADAPNTPFDSLPPEPKSLTAFLTPGATGLPLAWSAGHAIATKFRSSDDNAKEFQVFFNPKHAPHIVKVATTEPVPREVPVEHILTVDVDESAYWLNMPALIASSWAELQTAVRSVSPTLYQDAHGVRLTARVETYRELKGEYSPYLGFCLM